MFNDDHMMDWLQDQMLRVRLVADVDDPEFEIKWWSESGTHKTVGTNFRHAVENAMNENYSEEER